MSRVLVTGSADGLGLEAARQLVARGHEVVVHGRSEARAREALDASGAADSLAGDLASVEEVRALAAAAGRFDAVIHNAGVGFREREPVRSADGIELVFGVNVLAPYLLSALMERPARIVTLSSGMHHRGDPDLQDLQWERRRWRGTSAYSDSKLLDTALAFALARLWPDVRANAVDPGWVPTKMGGSGATGTLEEGAETQVWLAVAEDARESGRLFHHRSPAEANPLAADERFQDRFLAACRDASGVALPGAS